MKIGYLQFHPIRGEIDRNLAKITKMISKFNLDLIVLPELCTTGYYFKHKTELKAWAENVPNGKCSQFFLKLAKEKNMFIVYSIPEIDQRGKIYISTIIAGPENVVGIYHKQKLSPFEKKFFTAGVEKSKIYVINGYKIGLMICIEWRYPEIFYNLVDQGVQIVCHCANSGTTQSFKEMEYLSLTNGVISITSNRIGTEVTRDHKIKFIGHSQIIIPDNNKTNKINSQTDISEIKWYNLVEKQ